MGIHNYLVELGLNIHLHVWDGGIYRTHQIYTFQSLNNTAHQKSARISITILNSKDKEIRELYNKKII